VKAIAALGLSALCIGVAFVESARAEDVDAPVGPTLCLLNDLERPITGREDPKLLAATARKVLGLAGQQFPGHLVGVVTCIGIGHSCADPAAQLTSRLADAAPSLRPASECQVGRTIVTRAGDRPAALLRLDSIEPRGHGFARVNASFFFDPDSGAGWRCDAVRIGAHWIVGPCRMTWRL
jgi:hypothetical protein